ncbi:hypothetical protein C0Q70_07781 [Pomacea canaliculata]|uniref:TIR domain-containing protein n=1 Tax=Pomacea canaliculata TaxID=400727 RepID=A0A2T7PG03_POMCA|nr:hypothetical protein C0Q70_07781 [Pomacea canaliculata]
MPKIQAVDSADIVVTFVSDDYMASVQHRHELHTALCRQRMTKDRRVLYLIQANHTKHLPTYAHILPHSINIGDNIWMRMSKKMPEASEKILVDLFEGRSTFSCLKPQAVEWPTNIVNLLQLRHHAEARCVSLEQCLIPLGVISETFHDGIKEPSPSATPDKALANDISRASVKQSSENENISTTSSATHKEKKAKKVVDMCCALKNACANYLRNRSLLEIFPSILSS